MDRAELAAWLRLLETPGIGLESARRLLALTPLPSPQAVFELPRQAWEQALSESQISALSLAPDSLEALIERSWRWLNEDDAHHLLALGDSDYPAQLLATADPPLLLYLQGRRELLGEPCMAIVGSRKPTAQGLDHAGAFARDLSRSGYCIVSGLALGVDGAAHLAALAENGLTVAVLGTGLDQIYPRRHLGLARDITRHGLLISEYALGTPPLAPNFPRRNRIIAGLSLGTLVVEAALRSGSLITARLASEAGREVFAIPGSIHSAQSQGCHLLIQQGAKLVQSLADVLDELPRPGPVPPGVPDQQYAAEAEMDVEPASEAASTAQDRLLDLMGYEPISLDELQQRGGWPVAELNGHLLELELDGTVARLAGQLFQRRAGA